MIRRAYARVSKPEQSQDSNALEQQRSRLISAGATHVYTDIHSGTKDKRPGLQQMLLDAKSGTFQELIITRIDRLTRNLITLHKIVETLKESKVNFKVLDQDIDLSTASGKFFLNILGSAAEMESDMLSERSRHGWEYLRSQGVAVHPPFGYMVEDGRHVLDTRPFLCKLETKEEISKAAIARQLIDLFLTHRSLRSTIGTINQEYGLWHSNHAGPKSGFTAAGGLRISTSGLSDWLVSPVLRGHLVYFRGTGKEQILWNSHSDERLIDDAEYKEIELIKERNKQMRGFGAKRHRYPLSGLIFCSECGGRCYSSIAGDRGGKRRAYYYYICKNSQVKACSNKKSIRMDVAEQAVIAALTTRATSVAALSSATASADTPEPPQLIELRQQLSGLLALGSNPAILAAAADVRSQIQNEEAKKEYKQAHQDDLIKLLEAYVDPEYFASETDLNKTILYRQMVGKVIVKDGLVVQVQLKV